MPVLATKSATPESVSESLRKYQHIRNKVKTPILTEAEAERIALAIVRNIWPNRGLDLSSDEMDGKLNHLEQQTGISRKFLTYFLGQEILPLAFKKCTGVEIDVRVHYDASVLHHYNAGEIALALLKADGLELRHDQFRARLKRLANNTGIPIQDLTMFYEQEIISTVLAKTLGWQSCQITIGRMSPSAKAESNPDDPLKDHLTKVATAAP